MDKMDRMPRPGEFYRNFKNKMYQILAVAEHTETGEELVVYQALYGDFRIYARPLLMFVSEVDRERYPDAGQRYRFERVAVGAGAEQDAAARAKAVPEGNADRKGPRPENGMEGWERQRQETPGEGRISLWLERFLDAEGYAAQLEALNQMWGKVSQRELDSIYLVLDIGHMEGDEDSQLRGIMKHLETRMQYDGSRLRGLR